MRTRLGVVLSLALSLVLGCSPQSELPILHQVPEFELAEASGSSFHRQDLLGRYHLVDFIFTDCPLACPTMTREMKRIYQEFPSKRLGFVSVSVDPDNDTLDVLSAYRERLGVDAERWSFLRGDKGPLQELSEKGFLLAASDWPYGHSLRFVLLDEQARIRGFYQSDDPEHLARLRQDLKAAL